MTAHSPMNGVAHCWIGPVEMPAKGHRKPLAKRFEGKYLVCEETGCWIWTAATAEGRYGVIWFADGKSKYAHRVAYEFHIGPIPEGMMVCHRCDNGLCVNPEHLYAGSAKDNYDDMVIKGRRPDFSGANNPMFAKLTDEQIEKIKSLRDSRLSQESVGRAFSVGRKTIKRIWGTGSAKGINDLPSAFLALPG